MKRNSAIGLIAVTAGVALALVGCSSSSGGSGSGAGKSGSAEIGGTGGSGGYHSCPTQPNTCNSGQVKPGGTITFVIEKTIAGWNDNYAPSYVLELQDVEDGILPTVYNTTPDFKPFLNTDLMTSATSSMQNGKQVIVYKIKPSAVWNDGAPIDFADFQYLKQVSDGTSCPKCGVASSVGYNAITSMQPSDNGKTVTVVMKQPFADWQSMFSNLMPAHLAKQHGDDGTAAGLNASFQWFDKTVPTWSGGPMVITNYQKDASVTEKPNPKWYGKTKSTLDSVVFKIITDQAQESIALQNHEVNALYPQPSADLVAQIKKLPNVQYYLGKGLVWEHLDFNEKNQFLKDKALRQAIFTAIDRKQIIAGTVGQYVPGLQPLNNRMYVPGQAGYQDNVTASGQGSGDLTKAKSILSKAGYKGIGSNLIAPSGGHVQFRCTYSSGNTNRQTTCTLVQNTLKRLGIDVQLTASKDLSELGNANFDLIVFAWVATPFPVAGAEQIYELKGGADYGFNNDPAVEADINKAHVQTDPATVQRLLNAADKLLTDDAYELPLYQKPTFLATSSNIANVRDNATSVGVPYNIQEWGLRG